MAGTHAHYSPSGAERFHNCAGAPAFALTLPKEQQPKSGPAALLGTAAHGVLEQCLTEFHPPVKFKDRIVVLEGEEEEFTLLRPNAKAPTGSDRKWFLVDEDMVENISMAYDYVMKRCEELFVDPKDVVVTEGRTNPLPDREDTSGTADITIDVYPVLLEVVDYKNGFILVEHHDNPQLLSYLCGRAEDTGWKHDLYRITVVQPNAFHPDGFVRSIEVTAEELRAFQAKHRAAVEKCDEAHADLQDGQKGVPTEAWQLKWLAAGEHCTMCATEAICEVRRRYMQSTAKLDFADLPPPDEEIDLEMQNLERAATVAQWGPALKKYVDSALAYLEAAHKAGRKVPGKMVRKKTNRILNPDLGLTPFELAAQLVKEGYITDNKRTELFTDPALITGPAIEKLVPAKKRKEFAAKYLIKPPGELVWAPERDARREVHLAKDDFAGDAPEV